MNQNYLSAGTQKLELRSQKREEVDWNCSSSIIIVLPVVPLPLYIVVP
jgi:hypothetical protein